ncbi:MAG: T9SS type A sorting domain-containing protein [Bacteroidota bacterium]|nr:T9SS type A sorting domain-containing protein [Bacteroidota bacterium]
MKLRTYLLAIIATVMVESACAQERLIDWDFPTFAANSFSSWWPDGWTYSGAPWVTNCITANADKKLQFENVDAGIDFREVYQYVKLGIGTFNVSAVGRCSHWDPATIYHIKVYDHSGAVLATLNIEYSEANITYGPVSFTTTVDGIYKYSIQADKLLGWSSAWYQSVSCMQIDGNEYDAAADPFAGINNVKAIRCEAYISGNKIILSSDEQIQTASIISLNGSLISKIIVNNSNFEIEKPSQKGVYFVKIQTATQSKIIKIQ